MAWQYIRDAHGRIFAVNQETGGSYRVGAHQLGLLYETGQKKDIRQINEVYRPGQAFGNYTGFAAEKGGGIYGVTPSGEYQHLSGPQYLQLGLPKYNQYNFNPQQQSLWDQISQQLAQWNLSSLEPTLRGLLVKGATSADQVTLALQQTQAYKERFSGNEERIKNGLAPLSPGDYLNAEASYKQVLRSYGLPAGFYDTQAALSKFIGGDVSASELDARAKIAHDTYEAAPKYMKDLWGQYFGTKGDAIAGILDPKTATQIIQDRGTQVQIGAAAAAQGLHINQARAQQFQQVGVTQPQAQKAYQQIAASMPIDQNIAHRFGQTFGQTQEENDLLLGQGAATQQRQVLYGEEQGLFAGHAGANADSLGVSHSY